MTSMEDTGVGVGVMVLRKYTIARGQLYISGGDVGSDIAQRIR